MSLAQEKGPVSLGKALIFRNGSQFWACELNKVKEIVRTSYITPLPNAQDGVLGIINVRGEVVPVVSKWPGFEGAFGDINDFDNNQRKKTIILLKIDQASVGLLVEDVKSLEDIHAYDLGEMRDESLCFVYVSSTGQVPLVDGKIVIEYLKGRLLPNMNLEKG